MAIDAKEFEKLSEKALRGGTRASLLELLEANPSSAYSVAETAKRLNKSESTVKRLYCMLEKAGKLERRYNEGGEVFAKATGKE